MLFTIRVSIRVAIAIALIVVCTLAVGPTASAQDPASYSLQTGQPSFSAQEPFPGGFVNLGNGDAHFEIPLGSYAQRGDLGVELKLVYDSRIWAVGGTDYSPIIDPNIIEYDSGEYMLGLGWRLVGEPKIVSAMYYNFGSAGASTAAPNCLGSSSYLIGPFWWMDSSGTQHFFPVTGNCAANGAALVDAYALDGSGYHLYFNTKATLPPYTRIYARDGSLVYQDPIPTNQCIASACSQYITQVDANGNQVQWQWLAAGSNPPNFPKGPTDTLGRSVFSMTTSKNANHQPISSSLQLMNSQGSVVLPAKTGHLS